MIETDELQIKLQIADRTIEGSGGPYLEWLQFRVQAAVPGFTADVKWAAMPMELLKFRDELTLMDKISQAGAGFRSLTESIDTTSPGGLMMMQIIGTFAEFERSMLRERTRIGLDAARKQGRVGGRPPKLTTHQQKEIVRLVKSGKKTAAEAARLFKVHPSTVSRILRLTSA